MNTEDLIAHFGGRKEAQQAAGASRQLWYIWKRDGIPRGKQFEIATISGGALKVDAKFLPTEKKE